MIKLLKEQKLPQSRRKELIHEFIKFAVKEIGLEKPTGCKILLTDNKDKTETYAHFNPTTKEIVVYMGDRTLSDSFRSLSHELVHAKQLQQNRLDNKSGNDGSLIENEANSIAGLIMRKWGKLHPESFEK